MSVFAKGSVRLLLLLALVTLTLTCVLADKDDPFKGKKACASSRMKGWYRIHVVGTGKKCIVKEKEKIHAKTKADDESNCYAYTALNFFGIAHCEEGDKGVARGKVRASVLAEAYDIDPICAARVIAFVVAESIAHRKHKDVTVTVGGAFEGYAAVDCSDL